MHASFAEEVQCKARQFARQAREERSVIGASRSWVDHQGWIGPNLCPWTALAQSLSLLLIPSALATEGFCKNLPYADALFALTDIGRESKEFCCGRN